MNLSKSTYCKGIQCNKILWLDKYKPEEKEDLENESVFETGTEVGILARDLFKNHVTIKFDANLSKMLKETETYLKQENITIAEASFNYQNNFCSVDILNKKGPNYEIYEVKSSTSLSDIYLDDASYQYYVLSSLGLNVTKVCLIHLNNNYLRKGDLELTKLFSIDDITDIAISKKDEVANNILKINDYVKKETEPDEDLDLKCFKPYSCPYFKYCKKDIPENNVFDIASMPLKNKINLYQKGLYTFEDLANENINPKYLEQIDFELNNKTPHIDKKQISNFLSTFRYPLYFLDFESFAQAIPMYDNTKPYMQIPFQYSLHYIKEKGGKLYHQEFLAQEGTDPRRALAERLVQDIPKDTCVLAYNMSFEKTRIKELSELFPDLKDHLLNIENNIIDLMIPFQKRWYYNKEMKGSYSIKYVLPAMYPEDEELNYHNLEDVHNGKEATDTYLSLTKKDPNEVKKLRENLLKYCHLDTLAMVKIYYKLIDIIKED